ncbi:MAG: hypothetical protein MJ173_01905 [Clostridia bacterium]|nr:hypothetical protein [Clostridia bacterium]
MNKLKYKVYNGNKIKGKFAEIENVVFLVMMISGMIVGAFSAGKSDYLINIAMQYLKFRNVTGFSEVFLKSAAVNFVFIASSAFLGFSLIGSPFIYCIVFIKGMGTGALCGFLYFKYGFAGAGYAALTVFPPLIISFYALIMSCKDSAVYSLNAYEKAIRGRGHFENGETRVYLTRQLIYIIVAFFSSVIDSLFVLLFSRFFSF